MLVDLENTVDINGLTPVDADNTVTMLGLKYGSPVRLTAASVLFSASPQYAALLSEVDSHASSISSLSSQLSNLESELNNLPSTLEITETNITDEAITTPKLAANSIISNKIASGAVTTDKLFASAVTAEKIAASAITAEKIAAGAITAEKLSVISFDDLLKTDTFVSGSAADWEEIDASFSVEPVSADSFYAGASGAYVLKLQSDTQAEVKHLKQFAVLPGEKLYIGGSVKFDGDLTASVRLSFLDADGAQIGSMLGKSWASPSTGTWLDVGVVVEAPAGTVKAQLWIVVESVDLISLVKGVFSSLYVKKQTGAVLIEDGAITADKILAGAITADRIDVNNLFAQDLTLSGTFQNDSFYIDSAGAYLKYDSTGMDVGFIGAINESNHKDTIIGLMTMGGLVSTTIGDSSYAEDDPFIHLMYLNAKYAIEFRIAGLKVGLIDPDKFETKGLWVYNALGNTNLILTNLPTSSAGLGSGRVWNDGGTLKIV